MSAHHAVTPRDHLSPESVAYPESDGKPMAESDTHRDEMTDYALEVLLQHFAGDPLVYVSGNNFLYYTQGDPKHCVSPDTYVVRGVAKRQRPVYKVWEEEGKRPCFVLELTSRSTRHEDLGSKMTKYRDDLGVPEYFLFDPLGEWIREHLRGFRLERGVYQPIEPTPTGRLASAALGLELQRVEGHLRFFRPGAVTPIPTREERVEAERERADAERERAEAAEAEVARLREELKRIHGG